MSDAARDTSERADDGSGADGVESSVVSTDERGSRDVVVPMSLYKTVTVFSTLLAVVGVVGGFVLLDAAVMAGGVVRVAVDALLSLVGFRVAPEVWATLQPVFAVLGLAGIGLGATVYVLGSRFRAEGMGVDEETTERASEGTTERASERTDETASEETTERASEGASRSVE